MKKHLLSISLFLLIILGISFAVTNDSLALNLGGKLLKNTAANSGYNPSTGDDSTRLSQTIGDIINALLSFLGVLFLALTVYAGFLWMNSRGNTEEVDKAQEIIKAAVIGLIIIVSAYSIANFIVPRIIQTATDIPPVTQP